MGKKTQATSKGTEGRPEIYKKTYQGRLEGALDILKDRYTRDFPAFLKALEQYQQALNNLQGAGLKLAAELSKIGSLYKNKYGKAWGLLGQKMTEVESVRAGLVANMGTRFMQPMVKSLASEKKAFAANDKQVKTEIATFESSIEKLIQTLDKEAPAGTDRMLVNLGALSKKVTAFDQRNTDMLRDLQQSQQKQYISWSVHWHHVVTAQLEYHTAMEKKLADLKPVWTVSGGDLPAPEPVSDDNDEPSTPKDNKKDESSSTPRKEKTKKPKKDKN